ncbi:hypothetical protein F4814DRAFT_194751 [Daldinia grandis]|nr:hypothetical protein F4814DRAFT_194751 [Daldinia grandis]
MGKNFLVSSSCDSLFIFIFSSFTSSLSFFSSPLKLRFVTVTSTHCLLSIFCLWVTCQVPFYCSCRFYYFFAPPRVPIRGVKSGLSDKLNCIANQRP